jgi:hypothetical protein
VRQTNGAVKAPTDCPTTTRSLGPDGLDHRVRVLREASRVVVTVQVGATTSCPRSGSSASSRCQYQPTSPVLWINTKVVIVCVCYRYRAQPWSMSHWRSPSSSKTWPSRSPRTAWSSRAKPTFLPRTSAPCGIVANPGGEWLLVSYQTSAGRLNLTLPFLDLGAPYYLQLRREIDGAVKGVLRSDLTCGG